MKGEIILKQFYEFYIEFYRQYKLLLIGDIDYISIDKVKFFTKEEANDCFFSNMRQQKEFNKCWTVKDEMNAIFNSEGVSEWVDELYDQYVQEVNKNEEE